MPDPARSDSDLAPCPFCGGGPVVMDDILEQDNRTVFYHASCMRCAAQGPTNLHQSAACAEWNRVAQARREALEEAASKCETLKCHEPVQGDLGTAWNNAIREAVAAIRSLDEARRG